MNDKTKNIELLAVGIVMSMLLVMIPASNAQNSTIMSGNQTVQNPTITSGNQTAPPPPGCTGGMPYYDIMVNNTTTRVYCVTGFTAHNDTSADMQKGMQAIRLMQLQQTIQELKPSDFSGGSSSQIALLANVTMINKEVGNSQYNFAIVDLTNLKNSANYLIINPTARQQVVYFIDGIIYTTTLATNSGSWGIVSALPPPPPHVSPFVSQNHVSPGTTVTLNANATGGTPPFSYTWGQISGEPLQLSSRNPSNPTITPTNIGDYTFRVIAIDSNGASSNQGTVTLTVVKQVPSPPTVLPTVSQNNVNPGTTVTLNANPTGGTPPYSITWQQVSGAPLSLSSNPSNPTVTPIVDGSYTFSVVAIDSNGAGSNPETVTLTVVKQGPITAVIVATVVIGAVIGISMVTVRTKIP